jgi:hypothetical protein
MANLEVIFAQAGIYEVRLTVYQDGMPSVLPHTGIRQVVVFESREKASTGVVEIANLSGSVSGGGWSCSMRVRGDLSFLMNARELEGYIPVIIGCDTVYRVKQGGEPTWVEANIGPEWHVGRAWDDPFILFNGYIDSESISIDYDHSEATFSCRTPEMMLEAMQTHVVGFFGHKNDGLGVTFNDLVVGDVYSYMLKEKSNFADYHDVLMYYNSGYVPNGSSWSASYHGQSAGNGTYTLDSDQVPNMEYRDWTFNQGQYWSNIRDGAENQFEFAFCERDGAVSIYPDRNMWYPQVFLDTNTIESTYGASATSDLVPLRPRDTPIGTLAKQRNPLNANAPWNLSEWTGAPVSVPERMTVRAKLSGLPSYYKLVASLSFWNEEWGADYPKNATDPDAGLWLLSGNWVLVQGKYWSDQDKQKAWRNLWRFAARGYEAVRSRYVVEATFGLHTYWRLCDMVEVVYEDPQGRFELMPPAEGQPRRNWFEVQGITYNINLEQNTWRTTYQYSLVPAESCR